MRRRRRRRHWLHLGFFVVVFFFFFFFFRFFFFLQDEHDLVFFFFFTETITLFLADDFRELEALRFLLCGNARGSAAATGPGIGWPTAFATALASLLAMAFAFTSDLSDKFKLTFICKKNTISWKIHGIYTVPKYKSII